MRIGLVAIAKNEGRYLAEWISYHLGLGFDYIAIYDNESDDGSDKIIDELSGFLPVKRIFWKNVNGVSAQQSAYNDFIKNHAGGFDWLAYFDLDEFLVVKDGRSFRDVMGAFPDDVSAIGVNWLTYGSSGKLDSDYDLVTKEFKWGRFRDFDNNYHIKTLLKPDRILKMEVHHCEVISGKYIRPNGDLIDFPKKNGISDKIDHSVFQLNHYQVKSRGEFVKKINRGLASVPIDNASHFRKNFDALFKKIDVQEEMYHEIDESFFEGELYNRCRSVGEKHLISE
ncbi:glycosyltransferase family 2 protein [Burkholderia sp. IDO3]|uniref:glycosyltransferase family 2 protein n=1 Tax=Burkholderia sp. IDO3 TaxID=1705310 RepID=UPI000BBA8D6C|nr:glycosyltransferase family 2 protein [Burkholderia sp. IDO3]AXK64599.1 glycosyltransferase family 2 protein [Burkholderia sp. IDO3]PCD60589.1 hypothetical protein CN645_17605 [Burkholderia sp. IDO3]